MLGVNDYTTINPDPLDLSTKDCSNSTTAQEHNSVFFFDLDNIETSSPCQVMVPLLYCPEFKILQNWRVNLDGIGVVGVN